MCKSCTFLTKDTWLLWGSGMMQMKTFWMENNSADEEDQWVHTETPIESSRWFRSLCCCTWVLAWINATGVSCTSSCFSKPRQVVLTAHWDPVTHLEQNESCVSRPTSYNPQQQVAIGTSCNCDRRTIDRINKHWRRVSQHSLPLVTGEYFSGKPSCLKYFINKTLIKWIVWIAMNKNWIITGIFAEAHWDNQ